MGAADGTIMPTIITAHITSIIAKSMPVQGRTPITAAPSPMPAAIHAR